MDTPPTRIYPLSLHDALPILPWASVGVITFAVPLEAVARVPDVSGYLVPPAEQSALKASTFSWQKRSEEHTSELQSRGHLVCRLLLEKKKYRCVFMSCRYIYI